MKKSKNIFSVILFYLFSKIRLIQFQYICVTCILSKTVRFAWVVLQGMAVLCVKTVRMKDQTKHFKILENPFCWKRKKVKSALNAEFMLKLLYRVRLNKMLLMNLHALHFLLCRLEICITNAYFLSCQKRSCISTKKRQELVLLFVFRFLYLFILS